MKKVGYRFVAAIFLFVLPFFMAGCGGGGGGSSFVGAAIITIDATPSRIDVGDRTQITIRISDVHPDGIALKIRFPSDLNYVANTSILNVDDDEIDTGPTVNETVNSVTYLVYYFPQRLFGNDNLGTLQLELVANDSVESDRIEVDADVDDPDQSNQTEFDPENPRFEDDDSTRIEVTG